MGEVFHGEITTEESSLELEAKEDVEVVRGFVSFDTDGGVGGAVNSDEELIERNPAKVGEEFLGARKPFFPEGARSADVVFPETGLGFVNAEGDGLSGGEVEVVGGEALFVKPVTNFVHDSEE